MFYLFVDHFYFEYDAGTILRRSAQLRGSSRRRLTVYLPSLPDEIELHDRVKSSTKINHFSKEK